MNVTGNQDRPTRGILIRRNETSNAVETCHAVLSRLDGLDLAPHVMVEAGGCIDTTRKFPRWVRPGTTDLVLPAQ